MTHKEYKEWHQKADENFIPDNINPVFILGTINSTLLSYIAKGKVDLQELAKRELEAQGLNIDGKWVGFNHVIK